MKALVVLVALVVLGGCLPPEDPPPPRWSYLHAAIIAPSCATASCHSRLTALAGLDLSDQDGAYTYLVGTICGAPDRPIDAPRNYVTPGSPEASTLVYQLRGIDDDGRPYRDVMPPDVPLPASEVELVEAWIEEGARCD